MSLTREEILKDDFPSVRRGYEPSAVDAHLLHLADQLEPGREPSLGEIAGRKVADIVEAAERAAREIEADARREADELLSTAREQARDQLERAQRSVAKLVGQADELRERIEAMTVEVGGGLQAETEPAPELIPEPLPPQPEVDPIPVTVPEPAPPREPEPGPPSIPEPQPEPPPAADDGADSPQSDDEQAARLVAMKMALDGSSRAEVADHLSARYSLADPDRLIDAVFERVGG